MLNFQSLTCRLIEDVQRAVLLAASAPQDQKWYIPSKDYRTRGLDIVHVLDILAKDGRTHANSLIEVSDSLARFALGVSVKEACMPRLKLKLDPGHPECVRHDFNAGMVGRKKANALLFVCIGRLFTARKPVNRAMILLETAHDWRCVVVIDISRRTPA